MTPGRGARASPVPAPQWAVPRSRAAGAGDGPLDVLARRAEAWARTAGAADGPSRGHLQSWYTSTESGPDAGPPVTVPEERITCWHDDGSGSELVVATDPQHPGRPVIHDNDGRWQTVSDGKVPHRKTCPAGSEAQHSGLASRTRPSTDPAALREQLSWLYGGPGGTRTTPQLLSALGLEITFTKGEPEFRIMSGEVMSYEAWMP
ncbi:hypothetical protein [Streptomyces sp. NPDC015125]|uniref:hypothetical protein n=1 Tax=Streptomyces sp. NPDC015125 TaxID=3364938 RepID=UPI0036F5721A